MFNSDNNFERLQSGYRHEVVYRRLMAGLAKARKHPKNFFKRLVAVVAVLLAMRWFFGLDSENPLVKLLFSFGGAAATIALFASPVVTIYCYACPILVAREYDDALRRIGFVAKDKLPPALIEKAKHPRHQNAFVLTFYSPGIPIEDWQEKVDTVAHALGVHITSEFRYGGARRNDSHIIEFTAVEGPYISRGDTLQDDEL